MSSIDQNSALQSLNLALDTSAPLIDSREEVDRLRFLTEFATLINFYDQDNEINGNWNPFLMKDPVFLLATISKINFTKIHDLYLHTCENIQKYIDSEPIPENIADYFNQLLNQLLTIFMQIERWAHFMHNYHHEYNLKKYVIHNIKTKFAAYFWALVSLWEDLLNNVKLKGIDLVETYLFDNYDQKIWQNSKDQEPFWKVLNIERPEPMNGDTGSPTLEELLTNVLGGLTFAGDQLFSFLHDIIEHASTDYDSLKVMQSKFPDTVLLRAFVKLQDIQQQQLNGITKKHLQFYYKDILKQSKKFAQADRAFINTTLSSKTSTFELPSGTLFNAGIDADKNTILFESLKTTMLNPGSITGGFTLAQKAGDSTGDDLRSIYKETVTTPGVLKKDEAGNAVAWETFGGGEANATDLQKMGFAFASPMLLLNEGTRILTITMVFSNPIDETFFHKAKYYLSTQKAWLQVKDVKDSIKLDITFCASQTIQTGDVDTVILAITLDPTVPAIENFKKNPDGYTASWPMFKMVFDEFSTVASPPVLAALTVDTDVSGVESFSLSNDNGSLSTKAPYPLFGTTPLLNSSFIIGSAEMFSKPLSFFNIDITWDNLPESKDFNTYYQQYNSNLLLTSTPCSQGAGDTLRPSIRTRIKNFFRRAFSFRVKNNPPPAGPFNNTCFETDFEVLQNHIWLPIPLTKETSCSYDPRSKQYKCKAYVNPASHTGPSDQLYSVDGNDQLLSTSVFSYQEATGDHFQSDPGLQATPLTYTSKSEYGFIKMNLTGIKYGFGSSIYGKVVSNIALRNAAGLIANKKATCESANIPFVPKVKLLSANYSASQTYQMDFKPSSKPIQCFTYTPFSTYQVYDSSAPASAYTDEIAITLDGTQSPNNVLPLFPALENEGVLYMSMDNIEAPCELNLYFDLNRKVGDAPLNKKIHYRYLTKKGWKNMPLLSDSTKQFTCSGIVKVNVSDDISLDHLTMPSKQYWLSIGVENDPSSYPNTSFLQSNGLEVERTGSTFLLDSTAPSIKAGAITGPTNPVPELATVVQTFPSFDGRGAENDSMMNHRVSTRLKTKDRVINSVDYFRAITQQFPDIYYSKTVFNQKKNATDVYLVKKFDEANAAGAYLPMVSECKEEIVTEFLKKRASYFAKISVKNFEPAYVTLTASIVVKPDKGLKGMEKSLGADLKIFLSPWITSSLDQRIIDGGLTTADIATFIKSLDGVVEITSLSMSTSPPDGSGTRRLYVTSEKHDLTCTHLL